MEPNGQYIDIRLVARHLSGETSPEEESVLKAWLGSAPENRTLFEQYRAAWEKLDRIGPISDLDLDAEWKQLESRIEESVPVIELGRSTSRPGLFLAVRIAVAAAVILMLGFGGLYLSRNLGYRTLETAGMSEEIRLPDGSSVTLNSYSSLKYPKKFRDDQRDVSLDGEGFFEVSGDPDWPFVINAGEVNIRVLGTSFNVNAYKSNEEIEVIVETGHVAVTRYGRVPETVILKPGNKAVYDRSTENLNLTKNTDRNYLSWKTRRFVFEDQSLKEVTAALNKVYGSEISIPSDSLKEARITATFNEQSLEAILNVLAATLDLEIRELNGRILLQESN